MFPIFNNAIAMMIIRYTRWNVAITSGLIIMSTHLKSRRKERSRERGAVADDEARPTREGPIVKQLPRCGAAKDFCERTWINDAAVYYCPSRFLRLPVPCRGITATVTRWQCENARTRRSMNRRRTWMTRAKEDARESARWTPLH